MREYRIAKINTITKYINQKIKQKFPNHSSLSVFNHNISTSRNNRTVKKIFEFIEIMNNFSRIHDSHHS